MKKWKPELKPYQKQFLESGGSVRLMRPMRRSKGDCYRIHANLALDKGYELVHGDATGQGPIAGIRHDHAWCEREGLAIDDSNGLMIELPVELYYAIGHVAVRVRYKPDEVRHMLLTHEHYGPWDSEGQRSRPRRLPSRPVQRRHPRQRRQPEQGNTAA